MSLFQMIPPGILFDEPLPSPQNMYVNSLLKYNVFLFLIAFVNLMPLNFSMPLLEWNLHLQGKMGDMIAFSFIWQYKLRKIINGYTKKREDFKALLHLSAYLQLRFPEQAQFPHPESKKDNLTHCHLQQVFLLLFLPL
jgi:hypothetical protein